MIAKNVNSFGNALIKKLIAEIVLERGVDRSMRGERRGFLLDRGLLGHGRRAANQRDELAPLYLIELHSVPVSQGRLVGYPIGEDQSGRIGANLQLVVRWRDTRQQSSIAAVQPNAGRSN